MDGLMCRPPARARTVSLDGKGVRLLSHVINVAYRRHLGRPCCSYLPHQIVIPRGGGGDEANNMVQTVEWFPPNVVRNQKYSVITFFPVVLFEQFKQFANLYFLVIALSQLFPALQVGT